MFIRLNHKFQPQIRHQSPVTLEMSFYLALVLVGFYKYCEENFDLKKLDDLQNHFNIKLELMLLSHIICRCFSLAS